MYSIRSISIKTQRRPILQQGISPALALPCKVTGCSLRKSAACCRVRVFIAIQLMQIVRNVITRNRRLTHHPLRHLIRENLTTLQDRHR